MDSAGIRKLADLARIDVSDAELASLSSSIGGILAYVGKLSDIAAKHDDTPKTKAVANVLREDVVTHEPLAHTEAILALAPDSDRGFVRVKKIL